MARLCHFIKRNETCDTPQSIILFDCESKAKKRGPGVLEHHLTFGWAAHITRRGGGNWNKPVWKRFTAAGAFWTWVDGRMRHKVLTYIMCHNTAFDIPLLDGIGILCRAGWVLNLAVIDAPPTILKFRRYMTVPDRRRGTTSDLWPVKRGPCTGSICVLDTLNFFRMPLAKLGAHVGLPKLEMPDVTKKSDVADAYCRRDVEIIMAAVIRWADFLKENDLGGFAMTLAGQAMRSYRHRFMPEKILIDTSAESTALSRDAYYGGRTECFRLGKYTGDFTLVDVNSMYPAVMASGLYPHALVGYRTCPQMATVKDWLTRFALSARVTLDTDIPAYPLRAGSKLIFPTGRFETVLSTPEIVFALGRGHIKKFAAVAMYKQADIFSGFVNYFYSKRLAARAAGNDVDSFLFRILMNSLYGKFGQAGLVWETAEPTDDLSAMSWEEVDAVTGKKTRYRQLGGLVQEQLREAESRESFPAIAAHVTASARVLLWDLFETAGRENVYYTDTDSLLVNDTGLRNLRARLSDTVLGGCKIAGSYTEINIRGNKDYTFGDDEKVKGVRKSAVWLSENTIEQDQWSSLKSLINTGEISGPTIKTVRKVLTRNYTKGLVSADGAVSPFVFEDGKCPALESSMASAVRSPRKSG